MFRLASDRLESIGTMSDYVRQGQVIERNDSHFTPAGPTHSVATCRLEVWVSYQRTTGTNIYGIIGPNLHEASAAPFDVSEASAAPFDVSEASAAPFDVSEASAAPFDVSEASDNMMKQG